MAHLLLLDVPGGNDFTVLEDAVGMGHDVTFYTSDLEHYRRQGDITQASLNRAGDIVEIRPFHYDALERSVLERHRKKPFDAVLCLIDIRLIEASRLAEKLGLRFLNTATARLMRDKFSVRETLAAKNIRQPWFALAHTLEELRQAIMKVGYPALVKPSDGYGSQNIFILRTKKDFAAHAGSFEKIIEKPTDYGLGIHANNRFLVEQYMEGRLIGCDVFSDGHARKFFGINDKRMFPPPSFAIRGSCFPSMRYEIPAIRDYAFSILDALNFNFGAAHIEMMVTKDGPYLVEANPRLVSAQIPYQMGYALERSIYADLINLHLGLPVAEATSRWFSAIRWITAHQEGILECIRLPERADPLVRRVTFFKQPGDDVRPPVSNADRLGYVIAVGKTQDAAERLADNYVKETHVELRLTKKEQAMYRHKPMQKKNPSNIVSCRLPTEWGEFTLCALNDPQTGEEHIALTMGIVDDGKPVLTRVHSECLTGDSFYSLRCDCGAQLQAAMKAIASEGRGVIIYLRQEGRGIGLINKIRAYALQEQGADTVEANRMLGFPEDTRQYDGAKMLLSALGISAIHLMTNNPRKIQALQSLGIDVVSRIPLHAGQNSHNEQYLKTKTEKMGHIAP